MYKPGDKVTFTNPLTRKTEPAVVKAVRETGRGVWYDLTMADGSTKSSRFVNLKARK